jgi:biotin carboxyl carrier protein
MPPLYVEGKRHEVELVKREADSEVVSVDGKDVLVEILRVLPHDPPVLFVRAGGRILRVSAIHRENRGEYYVQLNSKQMLVKEEDEVAQKPRTTVQEGPILITAPMAGRISSIKAETGATVEEGQALVVLEAMKMENEIAAPRKGTVKEVYVRQGSLARPGDRLVLIE